MESATPNGTRMDDGGTVTTELMESGLSLLERNVFRLAEVPASAAGTAFAQRLKMLTMAAKLENMPMPPGPGHLPRFAKPGDVDALAQVINQIKDPARRVLHEFFWFWDADLAGTPDTALQALQQGQDEQARQQWLGTTSLCGLHNLALYDTLMALEAADKQQMNEAMARWQGVLAHPELADWTAQRSQSLNDPRFNAAAARDLYEQLPLATASLPAAMLVRLARDDTDLSAIESSFAHTFDNAVWQAALSRESAPIRERLRVLQTRYEQDVTAELSRAPELTDTFTEHAIADVAILEHLFGPHSDYVVSIANGLCDKVLILRNRYTNRTEDWDGAARMLRAVSPLCRTDDRLRIVEEGLKTYEEHTELDHDWVGPGYFDMPAATLEAFERGRAFAETGEARQAVDVVVGALRAADGDPAQRLVRDNAAHCIAYALRRFAILTWNPAMQRYNEESNASYDALVQGRMPPDFDTTGRLGLHIAPMSSLALDRLRLGLGSDLYQEPEVHCRICNHGIYGQYYNRTHGDVTYPVCVDCNNKIQRRLDRIEARFNEQARISKECHLLARALNPENRHVAREIENVERNAPGLNVRPLYTVAGEWGLLDTGTALAAFIPEDALPTASGNNVPLLTFTPGDIGQADAETLVGTVRDDLLTRGPDERETLLAALFDHLSEDPSNVQQSIVERLVTDPQLGQDVARACIRGGEQRRAFWQQAARLHLEPRPLLYLVTELTADLSPRDPLLRELLQQVFERVRRDVRGKGGNSLTGADVKAVRKAAAEVSQELADEVELHALLGQTTFTKRAVSGLRTLLERNTPESLLQAIDELDWPSDVQEKHIENLLRALVFVAADGFRTKALDLACQKLKQRAQTELAAICLDDEDDALRETARGILQRHGMKQLDTLIAALYSRDKRRNAEVRDLLRELLLSEQAQPSADAANPELAAKFLQLAYRADELADAELAYELFNRCDPDWPDGESLDTYLGWTKHTLAEWPEHPLALDMIDRFKRSSLLRRFLLWPFEPVKLPKSSHRRYWQPEQDAGVGNKETRKSKKERKQARKEAMAESERPQQTQDPKSPCQCGSGKRYENCHGMY